MLAITSFIIRYLGLQPPTGLFGITCPRCRLFAQVDFRREMRLIAFVDPAAFPVTNPARSPRTRLLDNIGNSDSPIRLCSGLLVQWGFSASYIDGRTLASFPRPITDPPFSYDRSRLQLTDGMLRSCELSPGGRPCHPRRPRPRKLPRRNSRRWLAPSRRYSRSRPSRRSCATWSACLRA